MKRDDIDFFAPREVQIKMLGKLSARELAAFEKELRCTPPFSPASPLLKLVAKESNRRERAPPKRFSVRAVIKSLTKRRRK